MNHEGNNQTNPDTTSLGLCKKSMTYTVSVGEDVVKPELLHTTANIQWSSHFRTVWILFFKIGVRSNIW